MHVTFLAPFLWYQLLKLAMDHSSSPCQPNCILFFDNLAHPHQSLLPLQSHWLMALPARQNRNEQQENVCVSQESNREKKFKGNETTLNKTPPSYPQFNAFFTQQNWNCQIQTTLFKQHSNNLLH